MGAQLSRRHELTLALARLSCNTRFHTETIGKFTKYHNLFIYTTQYMML